MSDADRLVVMRARSDPAWWIRNVLGPKPWAMQREILKSIATTRTTAVRSCHAAGKSFVAATAVIWFLLNFPKSIVITTATTDRQVRGILWKEVRTLYRDSAYPLNPIMPTESMWKLAEDHFAWGFTAREYDATRFAGFHAPAVLVIVDEAAGVADTVFEGLDSALASEFARMLMIGNPTNPDGRFASAFDMQGAGKFRIAAWDTPNFTKFGITLDDIRADTWKEKIDGRLPFPSLITPEWARERWEDWGEEDPRFRSRVAAEFPEQSDEALIPKAWVEGAFERHKAIEAGKAWARNAPRRFGLDVARFGPDSTVLADDIPEQGIEKLVHAPKQSTTATAGWARGLVERSPGNVYELRVDADGLGAGVFDMLDDELGSSVDVIEMRNGGAASDSSRFFDARSEWWCDLRDELDPRDGNTPIALPPSEKLMQQLTAMRWSLTPKGQRRVESKKELKKRGKPSPDEADAVIYARADVEAVAFV